ncbi:MAG: DUF2490 domain-containing protein [Chitinophagaceae bacterium]|nr:DUF2490 domain-containing protein [Chitinophagaceae bacterium]
MKFLSNIRLYRFIMPAVFCFFFQFLQAQTKTKEVNTQSQFWISMNSTTRLTKKWGFNADVHIRRNNFMADPSFYFLRGSANYWITDNITVALGYAKMWLAPTTPNWKHFAEENRIYQQLQMVSKIGKIGVFQRLRTEQRWQEKIANDVFTGNYKFTNRVRYLFSATIPVWKNKKLPSLVLSDELLVQFGDEVVYNTFDQNRLFLGIKQTINKNLSFDMGFMQLKQQKASGYQYDKNNTFRLFFYYMPDLRKH